MKRESEIFLCCYETLSLLCSFFFSSLFLSSLLLSLPLPSSQTPLHLAIITRQPHLVQLLVQAGASVNFPDRKGNTAIHLAAARRDVKILQLLSQATSPLPDYNAKNFAGERRCGDELDVYRCMFVL